jgi:HTH-type transcriptional regulator/antitoxin HigA
MNPDIGAAIASWPAVAPFLAEPRSKAEFARLVAALDAVLDAGGADESHPLASLADQLGELVARYEARRVPMHELGVPDFLRQLMAQHRLRQADLPEIGAQSVVSDVLRGKRRLNAGQIARLSKRFGLPADVFMP